MWECLNKLATIVTLIGFPVVLFSMYEIFYKVIVKYDSYKERNSTGGDTLVIGSFTRNDYRNGKKQNPKRLYHLKGRNKDDKSSWK